MACKSPFRKIHNGQEIPLPCGKCPDCLRRRTNSWGFRLQEEDKISASSHFITLTYDTSTVPISKKGYMTLCKRDVQLFFKRLRKLQKQKIKYYAVGEYGTKNRRPHYHIILFNLEKVDYISEAWTSGTTHVGQVSGASISYTCKYIAKPSRIPEHRNDDRIPEFSLISKGIGSSYLTPQATSFHQNLENNFATLPGGVKIALPKYYRDKVLDDTDKALQRTIINAEITKAQAEHERKFRETYGENADYNDYLVSERAYQHDHYFKNQSKRDL